MEESFLFLLLSYALTPAHSQKGEGVYKFLAHCQGCVDELPRSLIDGWVRA